MRRFCPTEEVLGEYISGCLPLEETPAVEKHLCECEKCRTLVSEASAAIRIIDLRETCSEAGEHIKKNFWMISLMVFLLASFLVSRYFFQFLVLSLISAFKWISDSRNSKTVIMIHENTKEVKKIPQGGSFRE